MQFYDEDYIKECIKLAKLGTGKVSPNPLVGCIIFKDDGVIGYGYHKEFGKEHAEVNAIKNSKVDISGSTVYINLEPCSYFGKTPPCVDLLIEKKVKRVVCGTIDPNPLVNGKSLKKLQEAGIETRVGVLEKECKQLNEKFFKFIKKGIPFVTLKIAQTLDGKISNGKHDKNQISSIQSRKYVHRLRSEYDAVLIGDNTVRIDNPKLTVRHIKGRQPFRVILNPAFTINLNSNVVNDQFVENTILIISDSGYRKNLKKVNTLINRGCRIYPLKTQKNGLFSLNEVLKLLGGLQISSVFVEGGSKIFSGFMQSDLVDKVLIFLSPKIYGDGIPVFNSSILIPNRTFTIEKQSIFNFGQDLLIEGKIK